MGNDVMCEFVDLIINQPYSINSIAKKSGVSETAIRQWVNDGKTPRLDMATYVLSVLGYELKIVKKEDK